MGNNLAVRCLRRKSMPQWRHANHPLERECECRSVIHEPATDANQRPLHNLKPTAAPTYRRCSPFHGCGFGFGSRNLWACCQHSVRGPLSFETSWRRGELNPVPEAGPRKHLHVYPVISFKEPNFAPAHCRLPSVREIDSPVKRGRSAAGQPAVHVSGASRRHTGNVTVN